MKKLFGLAILLSGLIFVTSCGDDEPTVETVIENELEGGLGVLVESNITSDVTWSGDSIYVLAGRIVVESGATLTIEAGSIVKGQAGSGANATALIIARGGTLNAVGTASSPIVMTSVADEITIGEVSSPNLSSDLIGLWGGLIVLGNAPISADAAAVQIEGIPADDSNGLYGGTDAADNSGTIQYVSIRHGGSNIGEGNEINGLTLGGVGTGTTIDHIEVVANQDDGIEFFGGTVNVSHAIVWNVGDDAIDTDQAWSGTLDNFIVIGGDQTDHAMELDGPEGEGTGTHTITNGSLKGFNDDGEGGGEYFDCRSGLTANLSNLYFFNFSDDSDAELDNDGVAANYLAGNITFTNLEFNVDHLEGAGNVTIAQIFADKSDAGTAFETIAPGATVVTTPTVGATKSEFTGWTWADNLGELSGF